MQAVAERLDGLVVPPAGDIVPRSWDRWIGGEDKVWVRVVRPKGTEAKQCGPGARALPASHHKAMIVVHTSFRHPIAEIGLVWIRLLCMANHQDRQSGHRFNPNFRMLMRSLARFQSACSCAA